MLNLSYNISPILKTHLARIEQLRTRILLAPLSPSVELRLRWEAMQKRLYYTLSLSGNSLAQEQMVRSLGKTKKLSPQEWDVVKYKHALDYIMQQWLVSQKPVTVKTIIELHQIACPGRLRVSEREIKQLLDYLSGNEHPVVKSAVAMIQVLRLAPFTDGNGRLSRLLTLLYLYKDGFDCRGLLALEEEWKKDAGTFIEHFQKASETGNLTLWLEYFAHSLGKQLEKRLHDVFASSHRPTPAFFALTDRQQAILNTLDEPNTSITNRKVQKLFAISQITASRDLAKLAALGLLFSHGKGRSVYYTRV